MTVLIFASYVAAPPCSNTVAPPARTQRLGPDSLPTGRRRNRHQIGDIVSYDSRDAHLR